MLRNKKKPGGLILKHLGIDFHVGFAVLSKVWTVAAGGLTVLLIPKYLDSISQGYYYTFAAMLGILVFFELGINQVVVQFTAHEAAHLTREKNGHLKGAAPNLARIFAIAAFIKLWSRWAAAAFLTIVLPIGILFFQRYGTLDKSLWVGAWSILVIAAAANLYQASSLAFLEGVGLIGNIARLRLIQSMVGYTFMWAMLLATHSLYSVAIVPSVSAICTFVWLRQKENPLVALRRKAICFPSDSRISWRQEIFPLQWRIAVSWVSGFFIYQAFVPIIFSNQGAREAGRIGVGLSIFSAITAVSMSWVLSKAPQLAGLVAHENRSELRLIFKKAFMHSQIVCIFLLSMVVLGVWGINHLHLDIAERIPSISVTAMLAVVSVANAGIFAMASFMHAHKQDPLTLPSAISALLVLVAVFCGSLRSVEMAVGGYTLIVCILFLPWTAYIFLKFYRK